MGIKLKVGGDVLFKDSVVRVVELIGHDTVVVSMGEGKGVMQTRRSELIVLADPEDAFKNSPIAQIPDELWQTAERRNAEARKIAELESGRTEAVAKAAKELQISERQLWRLVKTYQQHQTITAMLPQKPGRKPGTRMLKLEVERIIAHLIHDFYLQLERPTPAELIKRIGAECRKHKLPEPSDKSIARRLKAHDTRESQKKRLGSKKAKYMFSATPGHVDVERPLQRVEIDHTPLDLLARSDDPLCDYIGRPWLTIAIDVFTRCIVGIYIGFEPPSALSVALCMTNAVLPKEPLEDFGVPLPWLMYGLPEEIVVDNGKDFRSRAFLRGCAEYGVIVSYRPVGSPHYGGTIERVIGTMVGLCHVLPGTTKRSVQARGDYKSSAKAALTLRDVRRWFVEQLLAGYHQAEHRMLRIPPIDAWEHAVAAHPVRELSTDHHEFLVSFLPAETRKLTRTGVEIHRLQYWADPLEQWVGQSQKVTVHYDPRDISVAYVRLPSGPVVKAHMTTLGVGSISLAEWRGRRHAESAVARNAARTAISDSSLARSDELVAVAKASRALRRRKATKSAGDRWMPTPATTAPSAIEALAELRVPPALADTITLFEIEDFSHDYH